jgi:RND family efflux transporter MFP subunit
VAKPVREKVTDWLNFTGNTQATETVELRARVKGFLQSVHFEDGTPVKEGDLLFVIDPREYEAALDVAKAAVAEAEATQARAARDFERASKAVKSGALARTEFDLARATMLAAQAKVAAAKANQLQDELNLSYTRIKTPFDGRIGRKLVDVGNLVGADGNTHLATIVTTTPIYAYFNLNERDLVRLTKEEFEKEGKVATAYDTPVFLQIPGEEGYPLEGRFDFADVAVDPETGTLLLRGVFPNEGHQIQPGQFVRVRAPIGERDNAILVPERAIGADQRGRYVLVVDDKRVVEHRPVKVGAKVDRKEGEQTMTMLVVEEGLEGDEWVIVSGLQRARDGAEVKPVRAEEVAANAGETSQTEPASAAGSPAETADLPADEGKPRAEAKP